MPPAPPGDDLAAAPSIQTEAGATTNPDAVPLADASMSRRVEAQLEQWTRLLRKVALRFDLDAADSDELVQDIRIRIWRAIASSPEKRSGVASSYMYATVMSAAVDLLRRRRRRRATVPLDVIIGRESTARRATTSGETDLVGALEAALASVSDTRRAAVRLHLEGKDLSEIATLMGWTSAQARNQLYRGLNDLRETLQRLGHA